MCPQSEDLCVPGSPLAVTNKSRYLPVTTDQWLCVPSPSIRVSPVCKFVCPQSFVCPRSECVSSVCKFVCPQSLMCPQSEDLCVPGLQICVSTVVDVSPVWRSVCPRFSSRCYQQVPLPACDHWPVIVCPQSEYTCVPSLQICVSTVVCVSPVCRSVCPHDHNRKCS